MVPEDRTGSKSTSRSYRLQRRNEAGVKGTATFRRSATGKRSEAYPEESGASASAIPNPIKLGYADSEPLYYPNSDVFGSLGKCNSEAR